MSIDENNLTEFVRGLGGYIGANVWKVNYYQGDQEFYVAVHLEGPADYRIPRDETLEVIARLCTHLKLVGIKYNAVGCVFHRCDKRGSVTWSECAGWKYWNVGAGKNYTLDYEDVRT